MGIYPIIGAKGWGGVKGKLDEVVLGKVLECAGVEWDGLDPT